MTVPNVLATRYAGADLAAIWSPEHKIAARSAPAYRVARTLGTWVIGSPPRPLPRPLRGPLPRRCPSGAGLPGS